MSQQSKNNLDSNNIRDTLSTNYAEHLQFMCERPTIPVPMATIKQSLLWQEYREVGEDEIDIAVEELDAEFVDIDLEGMQ